MSREVPWPDLERLHTIAFDFDGVFTDNKVYTDQNGVESVRCDRGDGLGIDLLRDAQRRGRLTARAFILSKEPNPVVLARARKLKLECLHGVSDKKKWMEGYFSSQGSVGDNPYEGLVYLGNDLNDLELVQAAGFSVVPQDAHPIVRREASIVLSTRGGEGFVREFVERLLDIQSMSLEEINECIHHR